MKKPRARKHRKHEQRRGAAVVECALTAPLLVLMLLGALEVGQYIHVSQSVCNASRIGARLAARQETDDVETIVSEVEDYLDANGIPPASITVTVTNEDGTSISGTGLSDVESGQSVSVQVEVEFAFIRSVNFLNHLDGASNNSITTMRRD
jgi:Flp pilus assembly protein TadG